MRNLHKIIIILIGLIPICSSCVREGLETDCENYVQFVYDYNLQYVDLFTKQASKIDLYIFDEEGFLYGEYSDEVGEYFPENYKVNLPLEEGNYTLIAWSGLYEESYTRTLTQGRSTALHEFSIQVNSDPVEHIVDKKLSPLWYGKLEAKIDDNSVHTISLIKDTNTFRIVMKNLETGGNEINVDNYDFIIKSSNGEYRNDNLPTGDIYHYKQYYTENDPEAGAIAELNTLRLIADQSNTLEIIHKETGKNILDKPIDLNIYLNALKLSQYSNMSFQEYLDREDHFGIVFFYSGFNPENQSFVSISMRINDWYVREQDI